MYVCMHDYTYCDNKLNFHPFLIMVCWPDHTGFPFLVSLMLVNNNVYIIKKLACMYKNKIVN